MSNVKVGDVARLFCNTCKGDTRHELKTIHPREINYIENEGTPNEYLAFWEILEYRLWICLGCDTGLMEIGYHNNGMYDSEADKEIWESELFPKREKSNLPYKRFKQLNNKLSTIYREVISSYNGDLRVLCAAGLRALLEGICSDKDAKGKNLQNK